MSCLVTFDEIIDVENILTAWREFLNGKRGKNDVQEFSLHLMDHVFALHRDLASHTYRHGPYQPFYICDPKPRHIHKASVRDRLLHHTIHRKLAPFFEKTFIAHSYSCRKEKRTHKALNCFRSFARKESLNHTKTVWVLKCDIRKFFASIDHEVLLGILQSSMLGRDTIWLLKEIIASFSSGVSGKGLPLGNLTSQLLVNIYMNEFDQFVKNELRVKYYLRYADDFVVLSRDKVWLEEIRVVIKEFLNNKLRLQLHPNKVFIKSFASGVDFLGWIHFPNHRVLRTTTKRRMLKRLGSEFSPESAASYLGMMRHGNAEKLTARVITCVS